jgi:hypothetical protein
MRPHLAGTIQVRGATPTDLRVFRINADIIAIMPAPLALDVRGRRDTKLHTGDGCPCDILRHIVLNASCRRYKYKPQIIVERT